MKFKFKIQQYQTEAVENTVAVFRGQPSHRMAEYRRDLGRRQQQQIEYEGETGFRNHPIELDGRALLKNINAIQNLYDITPSATLSKGVGAVNLDIEMETGTGKTYVYIKTMFELNKQYGWSKFIIVVPSIAIREGVAKSFKMLEEHFMEHYGKKARWFIYNSANLQQLDSFSADSGLSVMIINTQAFAASMKEGGKSKESRIIYSKRDEFGSRRPIDVIAANHPIIIMDEPQKMEGEATQTALKRFMPLFVLNYSATHKTKHNTVYALDALDAAHNEDVADLEDAIENAEALFDALDDELKEKIGIKKSIKEYGINEEEFLNKLDEMSMQAFDDQCTGANPRYPLVEEIKTMYKNAYYGGEE